MKVLLEITDQTLGLVARQASAVGYRKRYAVRAVLLSQNGKVHLLHVAKRGYHKLPGGGIEQGENIQSALQRELLEEVGCEAEVLAELGEVIELREFEHLKQVSYCYLARQIGTQRQPELTAKEIAAGMNQIAVDSIEAAITLLENDSPIGSEGHFIKQRDLAFLQAAKHQTQQMLDKSKH